MFDLSFRPASDLITGGESPELSKLFERVARAVPFLVYIYDLVEHRNVYENRNMAAEWGYSQEEVDRRGQAFLPSIIHEEDRDRVLGRGEERFANLEDGDCAETDYRVRRGDGQWRWFHLRDVVFARNPDGTPRQILRTMQDVTEQKNAELALIESQRLFDVVSNAAPVVIYMHDLVANQSDFVNRQRHSVFGLPDLGADRFLEFVHPEDLPRLLSARERLASAPDGCTVVTEYRARRSNGEWRWYEDRVVALSRTPEGQPWKVLGTSHDITDRKRAEAAIHERQILVERIADALPHLLFLYDLPSSRILYHNGHSEMILGYSADELPMSGPDLLQDFIHPDDRPALGRVPENVAEMNAGRGVEFECRVKHRNGEWRWLRCRNVIFARAIDGTPEQVIGTCEDVTERKRAERALARFALAIESASDAVSIADEHWKIEYLNPSAQALFGYTVPEINAAGPNPLLISDELRRELGDAIRAGRVWSGEADVRTRDGRTVPLLLRMTPLIDATGRSVGALSVGMDVSERRRADSAARRHQAELADALQLASLGEMAANIAHELNQPLAAIASFASGCARRIRSGGADLEELLVVVDQISEQAIRGGEIIRRIKHLIQHNEPQRDQVDVSTLVRGVAGMLQREMREAEVALRMELTEHLPHVAGDSIQLEQVLLNLVRNAVEAVQGSPGGPREVVIAASAARGEVSIEVHDSGPGIDLDQRVFEPFFTTKHAHLGLGLSISRSIVEAHGGRIGASPRPQGGATFHLTFPAAAAALSD
jgi:PAS domain S-box-containing protein